MTLRIEPTRRAPRLPIDWQVKQKRRDFGPPRLDALGRAALFVFAALAATYLAAWWFA